MANNKSTQVTVAQAIISAQLALNMNEDLKNRYPAIFKKTLKNRTNNYLSELIKHEKDFDLLFNNAEGGLKEVYEAMEEFIKTISVIPVWEMENFSQVVKAYLKDRDSIEGIVRKVNRS